MARPALAGAQRMVQRDKRDGTAPRFPADAAGRIRMLRRLPSRGVRAAVTAGPACTNLPRMRGARPMNFSEIRF